MQTSVTKNNLGPTFYATLGIFFVICGIIAVILVRNISHNSRDVTTKKGIDKSKITVDASKVLDTKITPPDPQMPNLKFDNDVGVVAFVVTSEGNIVYNPDFKTDEMPKFFWNQTWTLRDRKVIVVCRTLYHLVIDFESRKVTPVPATSTPLSPDLINFWKRIEKAMPSNPNPKK